MAYYVATTPEAFISHFHAARKTGPVLVEFFADWCDYCADMVPLFKRLAAKPKVTVLTINYDVHGQALRKLGVKNKVKAYPFMVAYPAGEGEPTEIDGGVPIEELVEALGLK